MELPVVSIVGNSNSGKTTFIEQLIPELKSRGYRIATIKHDAHKFQIDTPGKDSWRHRQAGAETVVLSSRNKLAMIRELEREVDLDKILSNYINSEVDLVITEGYKTGDKAKIEIFRPAEYEQPLFSETDEQILTIVRNEEEFSAQQLDEVADLIEEQIIGLG
ncbi:molybdopterin-guanine dinucleotide biosynthesis protein B [Fuchsiella alkaliacetigena]|uniref:molybdopterin-guanine dinucleotide biosynthesis protein B n=1 Tax=Fuchsiella alkaliacetigena TaxID=957042 RepID=UPI00200B58DE|nr:molybdopterin-guanine dinucleotide biosynthesis protein B [Fuchsiella alkaliacetigena]MCK8825595.1 molybdopterin-guanine dinucleotide biosynthesis protein B [Fuchsiella alkaliacetigena]